MSALEKVAYLKGLVEGLGIDEGTKESKIYTAIIDTLDAIAAEVDALGENALDIAEEIDALSEDLSDVETFVYSGGFGDENPTECDCGCCDDDDFTYEVDCPACGEEIVVEEEALVSGEIVCPKCGEKLEFEFDEDDED